MEPQKYTGSMETEDLSPTLANLLDQFSGEGAASASDLMNGVLNRHPEYAGRMAE